MAISTQYTDANQRIAIALGDPAGIGIEVTLKALGTLKLPSNVRPVLVGCKTTIEIIYAKLKTLGITELADPTQLEIEDLPLEAKIEPGNPTAKTGHASFIWLTHATQLVQAGKARALVTGPIAKHCWHAAGHLYPGQTERLAELTNINHASMLFTAISPISGWRMNTLLATTHIPLSEVANHLTPELILYKLDTLLNFCQRFTVNPRLAVAGLNPHAGEEGHLGNEEIKWLIPTLNQWKKQHPEITLDGPLPPDTCWIPAGKAWQGFKSINIPNGILALYHDQGLIPIKIIAFEEAVNTTLGLPFIRTSPDHGTGFDIASKGCANSKSMQAAIKTALEFSEKNN